jgi:hypothetical protein
MGVMCGRVIQSSGPFNLAIVHGMNVHDSRAGNYPRRYNAAPSQELLVIRRNRDTGEVSLDPLRWGLIPYWCKDPKGGRKPISAKAETVARPSTPFCANPFVGKVPRSFAQAGCPCHHLHEIGDVGGRGRRRRRMSRSSASSPLRAAQFTPRLAQVGFHNGQLCAWPFTNKSSLPPSDF